MAGRAIRFTFSYRGDDVRLVSRETVEMTAMPSDPVEAALAGDAFWFELQNDDGDAVYRRAMRAPTRRTVEVRTDDPDRPFAQHPVEQPRGVVTVVVPDLEEAQNLVVKETRSAARGRAARPDEEASDQGMTLQATEVLRVDVRSGEQP